MWNEAHSDGAFQKLFHMLDPNGGECWSDGSLREL